jgi:hypothetical protein
MDDRYQSSPPPDRPDASKRDTVAKGLRTPPRRRPAVSYFVACLLLLGWHSLVIIGFIDLVRRQSGWRVTYDSTPQEEMLIFGVQVVAPGLLVTLLVGLYLIWQPLARSRISSGVVLGTLAASPMLLFVAAAAGIWSVTH